MRSKILFICFLFLTNYLFAQIGGQPQTIKGKVINEDKEALLGVNIYDPRGIKLATTGNNGTFRFNYSIVLGARISPQFRFVKKEYLPYDYKYSRNDGYLTIIMKSISPKIDLEALKIAKEDSIAKAKKDEENAKKEAALAEQEKKRLAAQKQKEQQVANAQKNKKAPVVDELTKVQESITQLDQQDDVSHQEIKKLKQYIEYLEATLIANNISYSSNTITQKQEIKEKIQTLKTKVEEKEVEIKEVRQQKIRWVIATIALIIFVLPSILAFVFYRNNKKTQALNVVLEDQLEQIKNQNEEIAAQRDNIIQQTQKLEVAYSNIHASILYAKRIQESILVKPEGIIKYFNDAFVFFQPKDIVSGDFYWFSEVDDKLIITAVDCTGHGVPGAFMTMMGNTILNEIVNEQKITNPAEILKELNEKIHNTLKQEDQESAKDGMDMALVCVDAPKEEIIFAGANNPLYYITDNEIRQIKATRSGIGGGMDKIFENHVLSLKDVKSFYLFSDGFQDQFGGGDDRKYMKKRFREFLYTISNKSFTEQQQLIDKELTTWQGNQDQTDDILVIGVKPV